MEAAIQNLIKCLEKDMYGPPGSLMQGAALKVENLSSIWLPPAFQKMDSLPKTDEERKLAKFFFEDYDL